MPEQQPEHQTIERRTLEGKNVATFEDLNGLTPDELVSVANECETDELDPESCVSCRASVLHAEVLMYNPLDEHIAGALSEAMQEPLDPDGLLVGKPSITAENMSLTPVAERFANHVRVLDLLVKELLEGPPIPPPNVTLEELAALVIGADKWVNMIRMQGLELAPAQQSILEEVERVVQKVRHVRGN